MKIHLYKLTFNTEIPYIDEAYSRLSDLEKQKIYSFNIVSSFYFNSSSLYIGFLLISRKEMKDYENILNDNLIPYICEDYSHRIINNELNLEMYLEEYLDIHSYPDYNNFIFSLNKWTLENLELDPILDRISLHGLDTLRPIDKEYLKSL